MKTDMCTFLVISLNS